MMNVKEIKDWLSSLSDEAEVGVDEGGLCLRVFGKEDDEYCEVGGLPEPEGDEG